MKFDVQTANIQNLNQQKTFKGITLAQFAKLGELLKTLKGEWAVIEYTEK